MRKHWAFTEFLSPSIIKRLAEFNLGLGLTLYPVSQLECSDYE